MIGLPKYVWAVSKAKSRTLYYYAKYRSTPKAWPAVALPSEPATVQFATRVALCERLDATKSTAGWTWHLRDATDRLIDIPSPDDAEFWSAVEKADKRGRQRHAGDLKTFSALIGDFKESNAYRKDISQSTREQYDRYLALVEEAWGDDPVRDLSTVVAQGALDDFSDTPAAGRVFRSCLIRTINWGIPRGFSAVNVVEKTDTMNSDGTYSPWTPQAFETFFEKARPALHMFVYSALFTGQRKGDVLQMLRPPAGATQMPIVTDKTNELVPVQIHSEFAQAIAASTPVPCDDVVISLEARTNPKPKYLHLREDGEPWTYYGLNSAWRREMAREQFKLFAENRWVPHGLRKNAVNMLLEVGCNEAMVSRIVGMSEQMVRHYSKQIDKYRLAKAAMKILEDAWKDHRKYVLGAVPIAVGR